MQFIPLLGKRLKDDEMIDLLELRDVRVEYDFDRLHEGEPDKYWAKAHDQGFLLLFDEAQILTTIFLYVKPAEGFAAADGKDCDVPFYPSPAETEARAAAQKVPIAKGKADFLGIEREWVRLEYPQHKAHYEFHRGILSRVTISAP